MWICILSHFQRIKCISHYHGMVLSPFATGRKIEEKCKTFPIKRLGVICELSSEAHRTDILPSYSKCTTFKNRVAEYKRHPPPHGSWTTYGHVSSVPSLPDFYSDLWLKHWGLSLYWSIDYVIKSIRASREIKIQANPVRAHKVGPCCLRFADSPQQILQNFRKLWQSQYLNSINWSSALAMKKWHGVRGNNTKSRRCWHKFIMWPNLFQITGMTYCFVSLCLAVSETGIPEGQTGCQCVGLLWPFWKSQLCSTKQWMWTHYMLFGDSSHCHWSILQTICKVFTEWLVFWRLLHRQEVRAAQTVLRA